MKTKIYFFFFILLFCKIAAYAQQGQTEFESKRVYADLEPGPAGTLLDALKTDDNTSFKALKAIFAPSQGNPAALTGGDPANDLATVETDVNNAFASIDNGDNVAVILIYRTLTKNGAGFDVDFSSLNTKVFHKVSKKDTKFSNYLLATKTIYFIFLDESNAFFTTSESTNMDKKLTGTTLKINYKTSYFKQSFSDLAKVWGQMGAAPAPKLGITIVKVNSSRVKDPCDLVLSNKSFKSDQTFTIHEKNIASFQVGVSNSQLNVQDISISGGNLTVKPNSDQTTSWKSNAYALLELHIPRDIDNFQPVWKSLFGKRSTDDSLNFGHWLYDNTLSRIGVYGGVKIAKDPLSNLYAGFNYAVTKDIAFNFGWTWANQYTNQVTAVGDITSVNDALEYAKRKYSSGKFSIGISFSPSAFSTAVGLKSKSADSGN